VTARQLALDCDPTWTDPEPDDDEPWCSYLDLGGQGANPYRLATMTTVTVIGDLL
jgi:hypothetical protein